MVDWTSTFNLFALELSNVDVLRQTASVGWRKTSFDPIGPSRVEL